MSVAINATATNEVSTSATTITASLTTTANNCVLYAFCISGGASISASTVAGASLTWAKGTSISNANGGSTLFTAFAPSVITTQTITCTWSATNVGAFVIVAFTGADLGGTSNTGTSTSASPTLSTTTTRSNSWLFQAGNDFTRAATVTAGSNQTLVYSKNDATTGDTYWVVRQNATTPAIGTVVSDGVTGLTASDAINLLDAEVWPLAPLQLNNYLFAKDNATGDTGTISFTEKIR